MNNNNGNNDGGSNNGNNNNRVITGADVPLMLKARYFGSGVVVGAIVSPLLRRTLSKIQPKFDSILDNLTGQAEGLVEKGSDLVAKAREVLKTEAGESTTAAAEPKAPAHGSDCTH